jgi:phage gp46-like protein
MSLHSIYIFIVVFISLSLLLALLTAIIIRCVLGRRINKKKKYYSDRQIKEKYWLLKKSTDLKRPLILKVAVMVGWGNTIVFC